MHDVTIRRATLGDVEAITRLAGELGYPSTAEQIERRLRGLLDTGDNAVFVAESESVVVGWLHAGTVAALETDSFADIRGMVVSEDVRSRGIGALLVAAAEEWARGKGMNRMRVRSNVVRGRAHAFYERLGYRLKKLSKIFEKEEMP